MRRYLPAWVALAVPGLAAAGWAALVKAQGDSLITFEPEAVTDVAGDSRLIHGEVTMFNRGKAGGVIHRVESRIVTGGPGRILVTRKDSRTPEKGWWRSVCIVPGESYVAEIDIELEQPAVEPVVIELDVHEIGRRLKVHRVVQLPVPVPVAAPAAVSAVTPAT